MNWESKARIQRACAKLPLIQEPAYYLLQATFGNLHRLTDPFPMLEACAELAGILERTGRPVAGSRVMEVGTGRTVNMPLGFFLCGSASVVTFDLHRYLKPSLVMASVRIISENKERVFRIFEGRTEPVGLRERLESLCSASSCDDVLQ